jgi:hypothetical protein
MMYEENGRAVQEKLWRETMDELAFAGVSQIL